MQCLIPTQGGRGRGGKRGGRGGGGGGRDTRSEPWSDIQRKNELFESYYRKGGFMEEAEFEEMWAALQNDLPNSFRFTGTKSDALAVREMRMTAAEALVAATVGGARALRREDVGRIAVGSRADLAVLDAPSHDHLAYRPGMPLARALDLG